MIIFRYLAKEIILTVLATTTVLLLIFLSTQFVHYLSDAAFGRFTAKVLFHIMALQVPYLLGLLLPLGFYLAVLTAYGRLYTDREMMVMFSCGVSQGQILLMTLSMAVIVAVVVAILTLGLGPYVQRAQRQLLADAKAAPLVETVMPGRFYNIDNGKQIFYIENVSRDHTQLKNVFAAEIDTKNPGQWNVISAKSGYQTAASGHKLVIEEGNRYSGMPGQNDFQTQHFQKLIWFLQHQQASLRDRPEILPTTVLWKTGNKDPQEAAELQWRLSMPLSVMLLTLLAVPMSSVNPRQGKFAKLLPAVLIYIFYANMMFVGRDWVQSGAIPPWLGLWWLHGILLAIALSILLANSNWSARASRYFKR